MTTMGAIKKLIFKNKNLYLLFIKNYLRNYVSTIGHEPQNSDSSCLNTILYLTKNNMGTEIKKNPLTAIQQQIESAKNMKDLLKIEVVSNRYISNYEAGTGRKDGRERYEREAFAFIELAANDDKIQNCDPMSIFAGFIKGAWTGLSFSSGKLSIYPRGVKQKDGTWKDFLVVEPDAHGKKEMMERMSNVKRIDEGVVVYDKDTFVIDALNKRVVKHEQAFPVPEANNATVKAAYVTIHFTDGHREEVIMSVSEIEKARLRSKQQQGMMWKDHYAEACKKTVYNRAFKVHYKLPDTAVAFKQYEVTDETIDASHQEVTPENEKTTEESGAIQDAVVVDVPKAEKKAKKAEGPVSFMD